MNLPSAFYAHKEFLPELLISPFLIDHFSCALPRTHTQKERYPHTDVCRDAAVPSSKAPILNFKSIAVPCVSCIYVVHIHISCFIFPAQNFWIGKHKDFFLLIAWIDFFLFYTVYSFRNPFTVNLTPTL